ncbi:hypothetical protein [Williamsia deligens]|uniref:Phage shock protein B n=1 Tax=Williamsia deligens TaxID=321325 RepID=A0ABW3GG88_9NOCA|nr:hypothetical protein [Williamsia deligens]MCP2195613.1 hypothetical protein [Williamsia deligens]
MVFLFWMFVGGVVAFIALGLYGMRLAGRPATATPYGRTVVKQYEREREQIIARELAEAVESMRDEFYLVPKSSRR